MQAKVYNREGKEVKTVDLPAGVFDLPWNADLVHQVVVSMRASARAGTAQAKTRGEVRGGGKKPWRQKGTGRARHGSIRSPLWRGGGVTHGPRAERNWEQKINRQMRRRALLTILSQKAREGSLLLVSDVTPAEPKTKAAASIIKNLAGIKGFNQLSYRRGNRALVATPGLNSTVWRSFRNLPQVKVEEARNLNPVSLLQYKYLIVAEPETTLAGFNK